LARENPHVKTAAVGQGFRRSIGIVLVVLSLDLITGTGVEGVPWDWPIVTWQMYQKKAREEPLVKWRRLVAHASDGSSTQTGDCGTLSVLQYPYRLDALLRQDVPGLLSTCLRELKSKNPLVVSVTLENRAWRHQQQSLEEHLAQSAPHVYRVVTLPASLPPGSAQAVTDNLIRNGNFESIEPDSGLARHWTNPSGRQGIAVDLYAGQPAPALPSEHAGLVPPLRAKQPQLLVQELTLPMTSAATRLTLSVLALATAEGATVELSVPRMGQASTPIVGDGAWHRVQLVLDCAARPAQLTATLRFSNAGRADAFVDEVSLSESPSSLGLAN
jgi:hypothetical protein